MKKLTYIKGDILESDEKFIMHGCNAQGVMGSGIALQIKKKYPEAYDLYREAYEENGLGLGDVVVKNVHDGKVILNAITQDGFGPDKRHVHYGAITAAIIQCMMNGVPRLAMPKIGAGLGGGDWTVIEELLEIFNDGKFEIVVYEL